MFRKLLALLSDAAVYGISGVLSQVIGFLLLPVYTALSTAEFGVYAQVGILIPLFLPLANLGMSQAIFRRFNQCKALDDRRKIFSTAIVSVLVASSAILAVGCALRATLAGVLHILNYPDAVGFVRLILITAALASIGRVHMAMLRTERKVKTIAALNIGKLLVSVTSTIAMVVVLQWGVIGVVLGGLVGEVFAVAVLFITTRRLLPFSLRSRERGATWLPTGCRFCHITCRRNCWASLGSSRFAGCSERNRRASTAWP